MSQFCLSILLKPIGSPPETGFEIIADKILANWNMRFGASDRLWPSQSPALSNSPKIESIWPIEARHLQLTYWQVAQRHYENGVAVTIGRDL